MSLAIATIGKRNGEKNDYKKVVRIYETVAEVQCESTYLYDTKYERCVSLDKGLKKKTQNLNDNFCSAVSQTMDRQL